MTARLYFQRYLKLQFKTNTQFLTGQYDEILSTFWKQLLALGKRGVCDSPSKYLNTEKWHVLSLSNFEANVNSPMNMVSNSLSPGVRFRSYSTNRG